MSDPNQHKPFKKQSFFQLGAEGEVREFQSAWIVGFETGEGHVERTEEWPLGNETDSWPIVSKQTRTITTGNWILPE